jgi:hypothetical protein
MFTLSLLVLAAGALPAHAAESKLVTTWSSPPAKWIVPSNATLTATISNQGNGPANAAGLELTLPTQLMLLSLTPSQGACDGVSKCTLGAVAVGQSVTVAVRAKARTYGLGTIVADATGSDDYSQGDYQIAALALTLKARPVPKLQMARNAKWQARTCGVKLAKSCLLVYGARVRFTGTAKPVGSTVASRVARIQLQHRVGRTWRNAARLSTSVITGRPRGAVHLMVGPKTARRGYWRARVSVAEGPTTVAATSPWVYFRRS